MRHRAPVRSGLDGLEALGYAPNIATLSVPVGYEALKGAQTDVFLGNWMPAQAAFREDLDADGGVTELAQNLEGAKFTLAVNPAAAALGVADFADLDAHRDAFEGKIYGIEPGAPANQNIQGMIDADLFGLGDWELVESGEQAMLAQVTRNADTPTVFLAWAPHPMNEAIEITYLPMRWAPGWTASPRWTGSPAWMPCRPPSPDNSP